MHETGGATKLKDDPEDKQVLQSGASWLRSGALNKKGIK